MRGALSLAVLLACSLGFTAAAQSRQQLENDTNEWVRHVKAHVPGSVDEHLVALAGLPWKTAEPVLKEAAREVDPLTLLRAAVLYLGISVNYPRNERPEYPTRGQVLLSTDGRPLAVAGLDGHVWWARQLVNALLKRPKLLGEDRDRAMSWYQLVSQRFAFERQLADQQYHLDDALKYFPNDSTVLFDAGCLAETLTSPIMVEPLLQFSRSAQAAAPGQASAENRKWAPRSSQVLISDAESYYRRSIAAQENPAAMARLGWLLLQRKQIDDARRYLTTAIGAKNDTTSYYAYLFLAQAEIASAAPEKAVDWLDRAHALFPLASAPHFGQSRVAGVRGDLDGVKSALKAVLEAPITATQEEADPWWSYTRCRGREFERDYEGFLGEMGRWK